jgi:hypothetical protein
MFLEIFLSENRKKKNYDLGFKLLELDFSSIKDG